MFGVSSLELSSLGFRVRGFWHGFSRFGVSGMGFLVIFSGFRGRGARSGFQIRGFALRVFADGSFGYGVSRIDVLGTSFRCSGFREVRRFQGSSFRDSGFREVLVAVRGFGGSVFRVRGSEDLSFRCSGFSRFGVSCTGFSRFGVSGVGFRLRGVAVRGFGLGISRFGVLEVWRFG